MYQIAASSHQLWQVVTVMLHNFRTGNMRML